MKRKGLGKGRGKGYKNLAGRDPKVHSQSAKGQKQPQKIPQNIRRADYYRNPDGKISDTKLSPYGEQQLKLSQGALLGFTDMTLEVKGNKLINHETKKVVETIDNDRLVNKIMFKVIGG